MSKHLDQSCSDDPELSAQLPDSMQRSLRDVYGGSAPGDTAADQALLELAQDRLARGPLLVRWRRPLAAAAIVGLVATGIVLVNQVGPRSIPRKAAYPLLEPSLAGDVSGDGIIDVRDAFLMAKAIQAKQDLPPNWDLDSDSAVDQRDVDLVMALAVTLPIGGGADGVAP